MPIVKLKEVDEPEMGLGSNTVLGPISLYCDDPIVALIQTSNYGKKYN